MMMGRENSFFSALLLALTLKFTQERALDPKEHLHQYGYLNSTECDTEMMKAAIKMYQGYFGLNITGNLDESTMKKMSQPRCGMPDMPTFQFTCDGSVQALPRWRKKQISYKLQNWTMPFNGTSLGSLIDRCIKSWTENTTLQISASGVKESDINVYFKYLDGDGNKLAYACSPTDGTIYLDSYEQWSLDPKDNGTGTEDEMQIYMGWAMAHELGHSLGLTHVDTAESVMYPLYNTQTIEPSILDRDMLRFLYRDTSDFDNTLLCDKTAVNAIVETSNKKHILIKGRQFWEFNEESLATGPFILDILFPGLPDSIDAAFSVRNVVYFLNGNVFYRYVDNEKKYRKKLISVGFENVMPSNIDAAFFDPNSNTIYFFKGAKYYGFNINRPIGKRLVVDGHKISKDWPGVPNYIEAATYIENGKVFFIKNSKCYKVDTTSRKLLQAEDCTSTFFRCANGKVKRDLTSQEPRRCGRPENVDVIRTSYKWTKKHLTYKIRNCTKLLNEAEVKTVFEDAIKQWTTNVSLRLSEAKTDNADIDVYFTNLDGLGNILGYAHYPENGDIYFDSSDEWSLVKRAGDDNINIYAGWLVAHELGHSFGLDHEETMESVMYGHYNTEQTQPSMMDNHKLKELYGEESPLDNSLLCRNASVDAILYTTTKNHILIKGKQYWHFFEESLESGPHSLDDLFPELPDSVDAAFSVKSNYFIKNNIFYSFQTKERTYRRKLLNTTFEAVPDQIDAAFFVRNSETINFFRGPKYYVYDRKGGLKVNGKNISEEWSGVPNDIEAATYLENDKVLFIKDSVCYTVEFSSKKLLHRRDCRSSFFKCSDQN